MDNKQNLLTCLYCYNLHLNLENNGHCLQCLRPERCIDCGEIQDCYRGEYKGALEFVLNIQSIGSSIPADKEDVLVFGCACYEYCRSCKLDTVKKVDGDKYRNMWINKLIRNKTSKPAQQLQREASILDFECEYCNQGYTPLVNDLFHIPEYVAQLNEKFPQPVVTNLAVD